MNNQSLQMISTDMEFIFQTKKVSGKANIIEIEFRQLHKPFGNIGKIRRLQKSIVFRFGHSDS